MRIFAAIDFPNEIKNKLRAEIDILRAAAEKGRFTRPENLHLTLVFLGEIPPHRLNAAVRAMDSLSAAPFELTIDGFGVFPGGEGNIFWRGIDKSNALMDLRGRLYENFAAGGFHPDSKQFKPHITLARRCILAKKEPLAFSPMSMTVSKISLMLSERPEGHLIYKEVFAKRLQPASKIPVN